MCLDASWWWWWQSKELAWPTCAAVVPSTAPSLGTAEDATVCVRLWLCVCLCVPVFSCVCLSVCLCVPVFSCVCLSVCVFVGVCACVCLVCLCASVCGYVCGGACICVGLCLCGEGRNKSPVCVADDVAACHPRVCLLVAVL